LQARLGKKHPVTEAEFAVWLVVEQSPWSWSHKEDRTVPNLKEGQLNPYTKSGQPFNWNPALHEHHDTALLSSLRFDPEELERFDPEQGYGRWLTFDGLMARWKRLVLPEEWIEGLITERHEEAKGKAMVFVARDTPPSWDVPLFAFDPRTGFSSDPRTGMFQERLVESVEFDLGFAASPSAKLMAQHLAEVLNEIQEHDPSLRSDAMPGTKKEFRGFVLRRATARGSRILHEFAGANESRFDDVLLYAGIKFKRGARKSESSYWRTKFPDLYESS
jgi:hypothetical protein